MFVLFSTIPLAVASLLLSDLLEMESGLVGGEESTSTGSSSFTRTMSEGVCRLMSRAEEPGAGSCSVKKMCERERESAKRTGEGEGRERVRHGSRRQSTDHKSPHFG